MRENVNKIQQLPVLARRCRQWSGGNSVGGISLCKDDPACDCVCGKSWESRESQGNFFFFYFIFLTSRGYYGSPKSHIPVTHLPSCAHGKHYGFCQAQMNLTAPIHSCDGPWHEV